MTQLMHGNQHSKYPKKHKKQSARNSEIKRSKVRLVIYPMSRNNTSLKINFTGLRNEISCAVFFDIYWIGNDTPVCYE